MSIQRHYRVALLFPLLFPLLLSSLVVGRGAHAQTPEPAALAVEDFESPILGSPGYTPYVLSGGTNLGSWKVDSASFGTSRGIVKGSYWSGLQRGLADQLPYT